MNIVYDLDDIHQDDFLFCKKEMLSAEGKIIFFLSDEAFDINKTFNIDGIPVLFPLSEMQPSGKWCKIENGNLIFNHDILKSCFYLLSGYQELEVKERDVYGRFQYKNSVQRQLNFVDKPLVNYYFKIIIDEIRNFKENKNILIPRSIFGNFGFMLTHDVDYIDSYTFGNLLYKLKEIMGLSKTYYSFKKNVLLLFQIIHQLLKFNKKKNPSWTFMYMRSVEEQNGFKSVFYFLNKDQKNKDSKYTFSDTRIKELFADIINNNCEIGVHGTVRSAESQVASERIKILLEKESGKKVMGIRQHRLLYKFPQTTRIQDKAGYKYDTTLCFAEHEGFRNSFCFPFKLYDFESDKMFNIWEIPLNVMDVTLFHYRKLNITAAHESINHLLDEVEKFSGVFTLLWHNDFFNEDRYPGVKEFYETMHKEISDRNQQNLLGREIVDKLKYFSGKFHMTFEK